MGGNPVSIPACWDKILVDIPIVVCRMSLMRFTIAARNRRVRHDQDRIIRYRPPRREHPRRPHRWVVIGPYRSNDIRGRPPSGIPPRMRRRAPLRHRGKRKSRSV